MKVKDSFWGAIVILLLLVWLVVSYTPETVQHSQLSPGTSALLEASKKREGETIWDLRFGHNIPESSALHKAALRYAKEVATKTDGKVRITVFPAQQLGNDHQMVEMARAGEIDIILTPTAKLSVPVPAMQYADLPFYFSSPDELHAMLDGEPGKMLLERLNVIDLVGVTVWDNGFKHFTGDRPLTKPADFRGLNIRTMKSRIIMEQFKSVEANPIPIDFHATRQALSDGVVNGQENPLTAIVSMGFHEVQSDLTISNHAYLGYVFSLSSKLLDRMPMDIQNILIETAQELTPWERQLTHQGEERLLQIVREAGVHIHHLEPEAQQQFSRLTAHIPSRFEEVVGSDLISKTEELKLLRAIQAGEELPVIIGLDTDLSMDTRTSGLAIKRGASMAIAEVNANGGVLGRKLVLLTRDHKGIPSKGVSNIKSFVADPNVVAVLGGQQSPVIIPELPLLQQAGLPLLATWSSADRVVENGYENNVVFRVSANDRLTAPFIIDYVLKHYKRPAIIHENSIWGAGNLHNMENALQERESRFVRVEEINRGQQTFSSLLTRIRQAKADVILMVVKPLEGSLLINAMAEHASPLPVVSHWGVTGGHFWKENREALKVVDLSFFQTVLLDESNRLQAKKLVQRFHQLYTIPGEHDYIDAPTGMVHAYDLVHLLALAIEQAGTTSRSAVRSALENLPLYEGVARKYAPAFTVEDHDALDQGDYHMARYNDQGSIEAVR